MAGRTPLYYAAYHYQYGVLLQILETPSGRSTLNTLCMDFTALHIVIQDNELENQMLACKMIDMGASLEIGLRTILQWYCFHDIIRYTEVLEKLILSGSNVNQKVKINVP